MVMNCQVTLVDRADQWSVLKGTNATVGTKTGQATAGAIARPTSTYYTTSLLFGVGSLSRCYIRLFTLIGYIFPFVLHWLVL